MLTLPSRHNLAAAYNNRLKSVVKYERDVKEYLSRKAASASIVNMEVMDDLVARARKTQRPQVRFELLRDGSQSVRLTSAMMLSFPAYSLWYVVETLHVWIPRTHMATQDLGRTLML